VQRTSIGGKGPFMAKGSSLTESHVILWTNISKLLPNASFVRRHNEMFSNVWSQAASTEDQVFEVGNEGY
jgi:hypothetical protein